MAVITVDLTDRLLLPDSYGAGKLNRVELDSVLFDEVVLIYAVRPFAVYELYPHATVEDVMWVDTSIVGNPPWEVA